ncbi:MAG TPA: ABC transporter substrate-binding protein [Rickettsia endosymbiont of Pyrocoelia pectoralis]|nr:ABC transporter substrate-binding protein [Rickettsia endosymbiont of Pyrocoelia pectoralis]
MQKIITGLFLLIMTFSAHSENNVPAGLNDYVTNLVDEATSILSNNKLSETVKIAKARELMYDNMDFNWMAKYTLGRNGVQTLSGMQIQEYTKVYSKYVIKAYTNLIKDYKGEKPQITGVRSLSSNDFMVSMNIVNNKGQDPIKVEYLVHKTKENGKDAFKIADVITEGISFVGSQQDEITNTLKNQGLDAVIQSLESRS